MSRALLVKTSGMVGSVLRARRRALKLSQATVAARVGVTQASLSKVESHAEGLPLDRLLLLCEVLGLELMVRERGEAAAPAESEW